MSRPLLPFDLPLERLQVRPWHDPVVDAVGHDLRSAYVERFWLALLGPSTTLLLRRLALRLGDEPEGFELDLEETARTIGLGMRGGANGPFLRAIGRLGQFHISRADGPGAMAVRTRVQTLTHHQAERLPDSLRAEHEEWLRTSSAEPTADERRNRACRLALSLLELGEPAEAVESQLHRWKVHPALAHESLRWALQRSGRAPTAPGGAVSTAAAGPPTSGLGAATAPPAGPAPASPGAPRIRPRPAVGPADDAA
jgi:hypothetical protein